MRQGTLSCKALTEEYIRRIDAYDQKGPSLNAVILVNPNAVKEAEQHDVTIKERGPVGPLHGIPVLLKDNVETGDMVTTSGSLSLKDYMPDDDAFLTKRLKAAGAIILAKANMHEFAVWGESVSSILGQVLNPYDLARTPGGSSGGTGAGMAANFAAVGIGTDTINSIRSPSSACACVGIRPTIGLVSRDGISPYSFDQDTAGPICRTVEDAVLVLDAIAGYDPADPETAWSAGNVPATYTEYLCKDGLKGKRIGVLRSLFGDKPEHEDVNEAMRRSMEAMKEAGDYQEYFFWTGFASEYADAVAEWAHRKMLEPIGGKKGARFGPGYPSCPDMTLSRKICEWSEAWRIGVTVTDSDMLEPEMSTSAVLAHRPRARIFNRLV